MLWTGTGYTEKEVAKALISGSAAAKAAVLWAGTGYAEKEVAKALISGQFGVLKRSLALVSFGFVIYIYPHAELKTKNSNRLPVNCRLSYVLPS